MTTEAAKARRRSPPFWRLWLSVFCVAATVLAVPADAFARRSGGYGRPSGGAIRTPSFGGGGGGYRTPSTSSRSGGYGRPSSSNRSSYVPRSSAGDRSFSQESSGGAFDDFRRQRDTPAPSPYAPRSQMPPYAPRPQPQQPYNRRPSTQPQYRVDRTGWLNNRGWATPGYTGVNRNFGVWDGLFLWAMLSNLGQSGVGDWFHNNQNDPGYIQWRQEAERQAQTDADMRRKLDDLERQLAERSDAPRTPGALPPGVPPEVAKAEPTRTPDVGTGDEGGGAGLLIVLVVGAGIVFILWRRRSASKGSTMAASPSASRSALETVGGVLRRKMSGEAYAPSKFRLGMTLALDPTPFILAGAAVKLQQPEGSGSGQVSVSALGHVVSGNTKLLRLYLPDGRSLVQLHLDAAGEPDECRLFGMVDEVTPADADEWGAWLDEGEGMIGWPEFQTKDGKIYDRVWTPGEGRVPPRAFNETIEDLSGTRSVASQVMLYAAATGLSDPAPPTEYIMLSAVNDAGRAFVEVRSGIDINPVTLQLA